jgi:hypothetical protein
MGRPTKRLTIDEIRRLRDKYYALLRGEEVYWLGRTVSPEDRQYFIELIETELGDELLREAYHT